jgi:RND superfamily putative drug exporter
MMFHRYGEFIARRAKFMLVPSGVALVVALALGFGAFGKLKNGGFDDPSAESSRAIEMMDAKYGGRVNLLLLVRSKVGTVDSPQARAAGEELTSALAKEPTVTTSFRIGAPRPLASNRATATRPLCSATSREVTPKSPIGPH